MKFCHLVAQIFLTFVISFGRFVMGNTATTMTTKAVGYAADKENNFNLDKWQKGDVKGFEETCYHEYWSDLPALVEEGKKVDPYNFHHRMALGKYLIEHSGDVWGKENKSKHWYWAYLAQTDWQHRSGRFQSPTTMSKQISLEKKDYGPEISNDSWWGYMNLGFTIGVYCGAAEAGLVPKVRFSKRIDRDPNFQKCVENWKNFFSGPHKDYVDQGIDPDSKASATYPFFVTLWEYHSETIEHGLEGAKPLLSKLSKEDSQFGRGWCRMVELLEAMQWSHLTLDSLMKFGAGNLPCKPLSPDTLDFLKENRPWEYETSQNIMKLCDAGSEEIQKMGKFWGRVAGYTWIQRSFPKTLDSLSHGNQFSKMLSLGKILLFSAIPQNRAERSVWIAILGVIAGTRYLLLSDEEEADL